MTHGRFSLATSYDIGFTNTQQQIAKPIFALPFLDEVGQLLWAWFSRPIKSLNRETSPILSLATL